MASITVSIMYLFSAVGPPIVDPLLFSSYAEHQYNEILRLFDFVTSSRFPILIGDFNHGPAGPGNLTWLLPFNYGAMVARGLTSPYVLMDGRCTFCTSNAAVSVPDSVLVDHVYLPTTAISRVVSTKVYKGVHARMHQQKPCSLPEIIIILIAF